MSEVRLHGEKTAAREVESRHGSCSECCACCESASWVRGVIDERERKAGRNVEPQRTDSGVYRAITQLQEKTIREGIQVAANFERHSTSPFPSCFPPAHARD